LNQNTVIRSSGNGANGNKALGPSQVFTTTWKHPSCYLTTQHKNLS